jgi:carboxypeptidase Q
LRQNGIDYFDIHHTADDMFDKIDPQELAQATAAWVTTVYLTLQSEFNSRKQSARTEARDQCPAFMALSAWPAVEVTAGW